MWTKIETNEELEEFMSLFRYFHDGCIKEMKYYSGAFINEDLSMHPINDQRRLNVVIQCQQEDNSMVELLFEGLKQLCLYPVNDLFTCEILKASMFFKDGNIYWCDKEISTRMEFDNFEGLLICATTVQWRCIEKKMGCDEFYK